VPLGDDPSPYVQKSAGNALRDIWRAHPQLVVETVQRMVGPSPVGPSRLAIAKLALRAAVELDPGLARLFEKD
jgi:3-methyladenine DNA glycosylase AlkC